MSSLTAGTGVRKRPVTRSGSGRDLARPPASLEQAEAHESVDQEWDSFLTAAPLAHHEQAAAYGRGRELFGFGLERVFVREAGRIVGGAQVIVRATPLGRIAVVRRGPLALHDDPQILAAVVAEIDSAAQRKHWSCVRAETFQPQESARQALHSAGFEACASWQVQRLTASMELDRDDAGLLDAMHQKGRYNVRRAARGGVEVQVGDAAALADFHELHTATAGHQGFPVFPLEYYEYLWTLFGNAGRVQHFVARHEGRPVAAIFNTIVGDHMYYGWGGIDRDESRSKLMANYLLHYDAMRWARDHGLRRYDLAGVASSKVAGPTQFKTRIAPQISPWPEPMVKYYGLLRGGRRAATDLAWRVRPLRRFVLHAGHRLGLRPEMPW